MLSPIIVRKYLAAFLDTKNDGYKDTINYSYWNKFEMDAFKLEWILKQKNIKMKDVQFVDFTQGPKTEFNKKYQPR